MSKNKRKKLSSEDRSAIYRKFNGKCAYCGCGLKYDKMTIDHIKPLNRGGLDELDNMFPSCVECNNFKNNLKLEQFRKQLQNLSSGILPKPKYLAQAMIRKYHIKTNNTNHIRFHFEDPKPSDDTKSLINNNKTTKSNDSPESFDRVKNKILIPKQDTIDKRVNDLIKRKIHAKFSGKCAYCGYPLKYKNMKISRKEPLNSIPISNIDYDDFDNLLPACKHCESFKRNYNPKTFKRHIRALAFKSNLSNREQTIRTKYKSTNDLDFYYETHSPIDPAPSELPTHITYVAYVIWG